MDSSKPVVILVDDEVPVLRSVERLFRREPIELLTTEHPREALDWVLGRKVRLVIADARMPEMTGPELLETVATSSPGTRRILFTGYPGETLVLRGLGKGLYTLVGKPWDDEKFKDLVREMLEDPVRKALEEESD